MADQSVSLGGLILLLSFPVIDFDNCLVQTWEASLFRVLLSCILPQMHTRKNCSMMTGYLVDEMQGEMIMYLLFSDIAN